MQRILVIEDEPQVRENITQILELADFEAIAAENGEMGLDLAKSFHPDLIICDIMMPKLDGYGVLMGLRQEPDTENIPFIFLTAHADRSDLRRGMELGADDYLTKPFTTTELLQAIHTRLEKTAAAERKNQAKMEELRSNITRSLPHELHTPLSGIIGLSQMLIDDHGSINDEEGLEIAVAIRDAAKRLYRLTQNFLLYAELEIMASDPERVEAIRKSPSRTLSDLILTEVAYTKTSQFNRAADLDLHIQEDIVVPISELLFRKLLEELLDNAFKFSEAGTSVHLRSYTAGSVFHLIIQDHGRGMTSEQIANLGAYMQFERKLNEQQGSGLGMAIARRTIELYGGHLQIESILNQQTTIHVVFPKCFLDEEDLD